MRHAILGPGGVGGFIASILAHSGEDVTLVVRAGTENGYAGRVSLQSPFGSIDVPVTVATRVPAATQLLWVTVKATQLGDALPSAGRDAALGAVVPLLNGVDHVAALREWFTKAPVVPATIAIECERTAPGAYVQLSPFARLAFASAGRPVLEDASNRFTAFGAQCSFVDDEATLLWSKLSLLAPIALSTTAGECPVGDVLASPERAALIEGCVREASAVGAAEGAALDANRNLSTIRGVPPTMRSSMQKDLEQGNRLELDAIAGPILRGGARHHIPIPATERLVAEIRAKRPTAPPAS
jgi:2-dehydropantoate 2-reductase